MQELLYLNSIDMQRLAVAIGGQLIERYRKPENAKEWMTREETARVLRVSARTIDNWRRQGVFGECKTEGRRVLIRAAAVQNLC